MKKSCILLLISLCTACSSVKYFAIETFNPSEITFPPHVSKVLIVNNAIPQPADTGYECKLMGVVQDTCRANADSALYDAPRSLGKAIAEADYFADVLFYHLPTRTDTHFLEDGKFTQQTVKELCTETGTDAIISFDRLLFNMNKNIAAFSEGYISGKIKVEVGGIVRTYLPERVNPFSTLSVCDSIFWDEYADNTEQMNRFLPSADEALRASASYIGNTLSKNFVPYWHKDTRWYYTGISTRWKQASAYAASQKWESAAEEWESIYKSLADGKEKAKISSNLALCEEMRGNFSKASAWAGKARDLFTKYTGEDSEETQLLTLYVKVLTDRAWADQKLNIQFGEE
ncbi:tetratricopeptide repeat protein [Parabacteroides sp. 52]|uniref:DUF6340 family protein n=1 Tax=unclassified Parabacteroides TaxID=2649774 RepID=UPI0013D81599|nr:MULTISPECIES: DUF6340 family protein [unclassified Parabacteroides]MDH6535634.1 hypothetical protein [Parabacteroides sp. PM5-20]NDV56467.1 tetratricopeptide repeat protein [Parabacteroides sp. 52]